MFQQVSQTFLKTVKRTAWFPHVTKTMTRLNLILKEGICYFPAVCRMRSSKESHQQNKPCSYELRSMTVWERPRQDGVIFCAVAPDVIGAARIRFQERLGGSVIACLEPSRHVSGWVKDDSALPRFWLLTRKSWQCLVLVWTHNALARCFCIPVRVGPVRGMFPSDGDYCCFHHSCLWRIEKGG